MPNQLVICMNASILTYDKHGDFILNAKLSASSHLKDIMVFLLELELSDWLSRFGVLPKSLTICIVAVKCSPKATTLQYDIDINPKKLPKDWELRRLMFGEIMKKGLALSMDYFSLFPEPLPIINFLKEKVDGFQSFLSDEEAKEPS
ncbi:hypothetical protein LguiB_033705 [Lonicera macranthoides]